MNLRQKKKFAKKELKRLREYYEKRRYSFSAVEIWDRYNKEFELEKIISYKSNSDRYYSWNEEHEIDYNKLTYVGLEINGIIVARLKHVNGRVLTRKEIDEFSEKASGMILQHMTKVSKMDKIVDRDKVYEKHMNKIEYAYIFSNDRTKGKRLHRECVYVQHKGEDVVYNVYKGDK